MSNSNSNNNLAGAYYWSMDKISNRKYTEFARLALHLTDSQIDDIRCDYAGDIRERNFQMCKRWEAGQVAPSVEKFKRTVEEFLHSSSEETLPTDYELRSTDAQDSIILIFHEQVLPQAEDARKQLLDNHPRIKSVNLLSCNEERAYLAYCRSEIVKHTYRIFIVTGIFETNHLKDFMSILQEDSRKDNTFLIIRKSSSVSWENDNLTWVKARRMHRDEIFHLISQFVQENPRKFTEVSNRLEMASISTGESIQKVSPAIGKGVKDSDVLTEQPGQQLTNLGFPEPHNDGKHAYILITSGLRKQEAELQNLVKIPWLRVFDFDPKSRVLGFLSNVEKALESSRNFTTSDTRDSVEQPDDRTTNWVFVNGYCDHVAAEFPTDLEIQDKLIYTHCDSLVKYCAGRKVPKVIILWYPDSSSSTVKQVEGLDQLTSSLRHHFNSGLDSFKCMVCLESMPREDSLLGQMLKRLKLQKSVVVVSLAYLCWWINENDDGNKPNTESKTLPQFLHFNGEKGSYALNRKDDKWLSVCFDIVASNAQKPDQCSKNAENFLKGGKLEWDVIAYGQHDATRDILDETIKRIKKQFIETGKSGIIRIFHAPGGGGTAFAKRVLWELRGEAPCLELFSMQIQIEEVKKRLRFIRIQTHLPAVLLIDGNSSQDAKTLLEYCRYEKVVILHVQRFYSLMNKKKKTEDIWLPENVSKNEAQMLLQIFSTVKPERTHALMKLSRDVESDKKRCMFEYGLTAFESEYHGVKSYVHGNLQISPDNSLENWHKVLTFLSLAHYYGQCRLPSKLFTNLLLKTSDQVVLLEDLPHQAQKFVVENADGEWKITYYMVAKEILEQVLVQSQQPTEYGNGSKTLSKNARSNLCKLAIDFILFVRENVDHLCETEIPAHVQDILTSVLIKRNYKDAGENDEFGNKSKYSRLVEDAPTNEDKKEILEKLVQTFPSHAEFHAHLGRFYGITKQFEEAEKCFDKAFSVREAERMKRSETTLNSGDSVLHRIHSMYGFYLNVQVRNEIAECRTQNKQVVKSVLNNANKAIHHFRKSKKHYQKGCNPTYVYIGEIKVRLCLAEFAIKISKGDIALLHNDADPFNRLADFVLESFSYCDELLAHCMYYAEEHNIPKEELNFCINSFNSFYTNAEKALKHWVGKDETVRSKKCHVAILKMAMKQGHSSKFQIYEDANDFSRLSQLITLYEGIFRDAQKNNSETHALSNYMTEWLQAIRHPLLKDRNYKLAQVNACVEYWDSKNERGSLATFYHYVLTTLLAMNGPPGEVANNYSEQSYHLKDKIKDCTIPLVLMERTSEWLSRENDSQSLKNIIHRNLLGKWEDKFWKKEKAHLLKVCKGKIITCKVWYGHIVLDGAQRPEVTLFFNPQRYGFSESEEKKKTRVEFYVGFNPNHGAEAFQVSRLEKSVCTECQIFTEISKLGRDKSEWKGCCPKCENEVVAASS